MLRLAARRTTDDDPSPRLERPQAAADIAFIPPQGVHQVAMATQNKASGALVILTFRTPSDTDPRIFQGAFLAQQCPAVVCFRRMRGDEPSAFPPGE